MIALIGITIERNVTISSAKASESTKRKTHGARCFISSLKSNEPAVRPVTGASAFGSLADGGGHDLGPQDVQCAVGRVVGAVAGQRHVDRRDGAVPAVDDRDRVPHQPGVDRLVAQLADRGGGLQRADVVGLQRDGRGQRLPGNAFWMRS